VLTGGRLAHAELEKAEDMMVRINAAYEALQTKTGL